MTGAFEEHAVIGDHAARRILSPDHVDRLGEALLALASEVWIVKDRLAVLEEVLKAGGLDVAAAIDGFVPSPALERSLAAQRDALIAAVVAALKAD